MVADYQFKVLPKCVNAKSNDTYDLTPEQIQFYNENGFLVIKKLISQPALDIYRNRFSDICSGRVSRDHISIIKDRALCKPGSKPEQYIYKIQELLYDEVYSTYSEDPRLLHIVRQLIGEDLTGLNCTLINKPPGTGIHPPHQDLIYLPIRPAEKILASWTAIDSVNKDNGCLFVVPGSHKPNELYEHKEQPHESKQFFYTITNWKTIAPGSKRVYLEMGPGDTVFFGSTLVHGSKANISQIYRKALTCHYVNSNYHFIEVAGTYHEPIARDIEAEIRRRGGELNIADIWRVKSKKIRGVSHL